MKLIKSDKKVVTYLTEIYELVKGINLEVYLTDGEIKNQTISYKGKIKEVHEYSYVKDIEDFKNQCRTHHFYDTDDGNYWFREYLVDDLNKEFAENGFNVDNLILVKYHDHTILDAKGVPLDILVHSDYIGGFKQADHDSDYETIWDWEALKEHLSKHPDVINYKCEEIPYYNSSFYGQEGLDFDYVFKSEWRNKFTRKSCWRSVALGEDGFDPLEVQQFKIKN